MIWGFIELPLEKPERCHDGASPGIDVVNAQNLRAVSVYLQTAVLLIKMRAFTHKPTRLNYAARLQLTCLVNRVLASKTHTWIWDCGLTSVYLPSIYKPLALSPSTTSKWYKSVGLPRQTAFCPFLDKWGLSISVESLTHETIIRKLLEATVNSCGLSEYGWVGCLLRKEESSRPCPSRLHRMAEVPVSLTLMCLRRHTCTLSCRA